MTEPQTLLADDVCRVCYHGPHPDRPCVDIEETPTEDGEVEKSVCGCPEYVDLEAESRIVVKVEPPMTEPQTPTDALAAMLRAEGSYFARHEAVAEKLIDFMPDGWVITDATRLAAALTPLADSISAISSQRFGFDPQREAAAIIEALSHD